MHLVVRKAIALSHLRKFQAPVLPPSPYPSDHDRTRDKALLIGIEYNPAHDDVKALGNPHRDIDLFKEYLMEQEGYLPERIRVLKDDGQHPLTQPTKNNILMEIDNLVRDVKRGDRLVFVFAGHGCQTLNRTGSEPDGKDEGALASNHCGWPVDEEGNALPSELPKGIPKDHPHQKKLDGVVIDNELREHLVNPLPAGSQLVAFLETCHSQTLLDLDSKRWKNSLPAVVSKGTQFISRGIRSATFSHALPSLGPVFTGPRRRKSTKQGEPELPPSPRSKSWEIPVKVTAEKKHMHGGDATVISFASAGDDQESFDAAGKPSMISIVVEHLNARAISKRESDDTVDALKDTTPRQLAHHIRAKWNEKRVDDAVPVWREKNPRKAKKFKFISHIVRVVCAVQMPGVTSLGSTEALDRALQL